MKALSKEDRRVLLQEAALPIVVTTEHALAMKATLSISWNTKTVGNTKWNEVNRAGLMGEQGAESIHAHLNRLEAQFSGIVNHLDRLKYIVNQHNIDSAPLLNSLKPPPKKRTRAEMEDD